MQFALPYLIAQNTVEAELEARLRDTGNARWTDAELYRAISDALVAWSGRVSYPNVYTLPGGWVNGTYEYAIPDYMNGRIQPQRLVAVPYVNTSIDSSEYVWEDVVGWTIEPDGSGGQYLRLQWNEGTVGATTDARILWWSQQGPIPSTVPTVQTTINSTATSLILSGLVNVGQAGYVFVDSEWIQYAGFTDNGTYTTLTNLVRGMNNSTAASHNSGQSVYFGIAMPDMRLLLNLYAQAQANAFAFGLVDVNETERNRYEWNMRYYQQIADEFWLRWTPQVSPSIMLSRRAIG